MKKPSMSDYRSVLKFEYNLKIQKNKSYSLRAFARDLQITPSRLSEILSGKQGLSPQKALHLAKQLKYNKKKSEWFCNLVSSEYSRSPYIKAQAKEKLRPFLNGVEQEALSYEMPFVVQKIHFIIRRLTQVKNFQSDPKWIAKKLSEPEAKIKKAISEMLRAGMLKKEASGELFINENYSVHTNNSKSTTIASNLYKDCFNDIITAKEKFPLSQRHAGIHFFSYNKNQIEEIKSLIQEFEDKLDHLTYKTQDPDSVYMVMISLNPNIDVAHEGTNEK